MKFSQLTSSRRWIALGLLIVLIPLIPRWLLIRRYTERIFSPVNAPGKPTAIVFGAGLRRDGNPTSVLADRVTTAAFLYHEGKVSQILMSGSIHGTNYNEPLAMQSLALDLGVPAKDILIDTSGSRSLQTCQRAHQIFGIEHALLISQRFHLPRALALCDAVGLSTDGVISDLRPYRASFLWELREIPATLRALWDVLTIKNHAIHSPTEGLEERKG
jgi:SanA protein